MHKLSCNDASSTLEANTHLCSSALTFRSQRSMNFLFSVQREQYRSLKTSVSLPKGDQTITKWSVNPQNTLFYSLCVMSR